MAKHKLGSAGKEDQGWLLSKNAKVFEKKPPKQNSPDEIS